MSPSLETISSVHNWAWFFLISSLVIGVVSSILIYWSANKKEEYLKCRVTNAEQRAAEANKKAEEERLGRVKIEEKLAPRYLEPAQQEDLSDKLKQFAGTAIDIFLYPEGAPDIIPLKNQIVRTLQSAGWNARFWTVIASGQEVSGIIILTQTETDKTVEAAAKTLIDGLNSGGIFAWRTFPFSGSEPPGAGISGTVPWDSSKIAPLRMLIGIKPEIPARLKRRLNFPPFRGD